MELRYAYIILLALGISFLFVQLLVKRKRAVHIAFAIFSGSMAMVAAKQLGADSLGPYHYLIGLGTCATCNGFWLVSRGLFREKNAIEARHIAVALIIAALIIVSQMLQMTSAMSIETSKNSQLLASAIATMSEFLSSTILALSFWEALRGYSKASGAAKHQRTLFMVSYGGVLFLCMFFAQVFLNETQFEALFPWFTVISALLLLSVSQSILLWQQIENKKAIKAKSAAKEVDTETKASSVIVIDNEIQKLMSDIQTFVEHEKSFLISSLKIKDVANELDVSEYLISRIIRQCLQVENFNQYINHLRIEHAKGLLSSISIQHWTILVIALESGFSSVVSFNRVFKLACECTPTQYRQRCVEDGVKTLSLSA
ncbi:MAG: AraC-like DNA-binding protein [Glaciecola sp.]|jgi:AraC-like DNA-binding protein